jgi:hypothetical protein
MIKFLWKESEINAEGKKVDVEYQVKAIAQLELIN